MTLVAMMTAEIDVKQRVCRVDVNSMAQVDPSLPCVVAQVIPCITQSRVYLRRMKTQVSRQRKVDDGLFQLSKPDVGPTPTQVTYDVVGVPADKLIEMVEGNLCRKLFVDLLQNIQGLAHPITVSVQGQAQLQGPGRPFRLYQTLIDGAL